MRTFWDKVRDRLWLTTNWYSLNLTDQPKTETAENIDVHFRLMRQEDLDKLFYSFPKELSEKISDPEQSTLRSRQGSFCGGDGIGQIPGWILLYLCHRYLCRGNEKDVFCFQRHSLSI